MSKRFFLSYFLLACVYFVQGQAPIIVSDTDGNISEINLPNNCNKRIIKNVGRSLSDITLHPNGKMYGVSFSRGEMYEIDTTNATSGTNSLTTIIDFGNINMVGMTAANNGKVYVSEVGRPSRLFEVDVTTNTFISKGMLANGSAGDLTWYLGELYNASDDDKLVKVNINNPAASIVIGDFVNNDDEIFSLATNAFSCDSSVTYGITEDRDYFRINMTSGVTTFLCSGSGPRIFGSTSRDEFIASETCVLTVDLDDDNSSGASGDDFNGNFNCVTGIGKVADNDVLVESDNAIDSIVITISSGIIDGSNEFLSIGSSPNINSNNNAQKIVAINNGSATLANFETFLATLEYRNATTPASLGNRLVEVVAYGDGESSPVATSTMSISTDVNAGNNANKTFCSNDEASDLIQALGGNPDAGGTWKPELSNGNNFFDPDVDIPGIYIYVVTDGCYTDSASVTVTIDSAGNAGEDGALVICQTDPSVDLFDAINASPETGGSWSPALNSGSGIFNPSIDDAGDYTYSIAACNNPSATVSVTITNIPNAGNDGIANICENDDAVDLFDFLGNNPDAGGSWSPALTSGTGTFDPSIDSAGTYTYEVIGCDTSSAEVIVNIDSAVYAGMGGTLTICTTDDTVNLLNSLTDNPDAGGEWIPPLASGSNTFDPSVDTSGVYTYLVTGSASCGNSSAQVIVTVSICAVNLDLDDDNSSGASGSDFQGALVCPDSVADIADIDLSIDTDAFIDSVIVEIIGGILDGANEFLQVVKIQNISSNNLSSKLKATNEGLANIENFESFISAIDYINTAEPFTEGDRLIEVTVYNQDGSASAQSTISLLRNQVNAGQDNTIQVLDTDPSFNLFDRLNGNPDFDGIWSPTLSSGTNLFEPSIDEEGIYTYIVSDECDTDSAEISVEIVKIETDSCELSSLFVPNAFTPNGDNRNDVLFVNILGEHDRMDFRIYNRWGQLVFETTDITMGWNGVYEGELQSTDVFGYYLEIECDGEIVQQKGNITLIR